MSSGRNSHYWCHECMRPINLQGRCLICPYCNGGFVQELYEVMGTRQQDVRYHNEASSDFGFMEPFPDPRFIDNFADFMINRMAAINSNFDIRTRSANVPEQGLAFGSGPWLIFHGHGPVRMSSNGGFEFVFNGSPRFGQRRANVDGFFLGSALQDLIEQVTQNDRQGPPPAPRAAIDAMPTIKITQRHLNTDSYCPVCQDKFELGSEARKMPCNHIYHTQCIVPWLVQHNSCPICRLELPQVSGGGRGIRRPISLDGNTSSSDNTSERDDSEQNQGRRNLLSYIWPFRSSNQNPRRHSETGENSSAASNEENETNYSGWSFN